MKRSARGISAGAAGRFLSLIGYPAFTPDAPRVRWMKRFGLIEVTGTPAAQAAEAVRIASDLAASLSVPLAEFDSVIGAFSGAVPGVGVCIAKPRCAECPVRRDCPVPAMAKLAGVSDESPPGATLAESMLPQDMPRERLLARGAGALQDAELLAILLRTGSGGENALRLATRILREFGSLDRIATASANELAKKKGVGPVKAVTIKAALELARRMERDDPREGEPIISAAQVYPLLRKRFMGARREEFVALLLNARNILFRVVTISEGTLTQSLVHPREAFAEATKDSAAAIVFAHNHPSGDPTPSRDDDAITTRLVKAGEVMGVRVLDHIVVGRDGYYSFADAGKIKQQT